MKLFPGRQSSELAPVNYPHGVNLDPAGRQLYVRSTQVGNGDPSWLQRETVFATVAAALSHCRSGYHDVVNVLPGHTESIATADAWANLVAGTRIVGWGRGNLRPTFTWTAAAATVLLNVANVSIENVIMQMAGDPAATTALTVAAPITVSAAGCAIIGCRINFGVDADQIVTIGITTTADADDFEFIGNQCHSPTTAECTTFLRLVGADRCRIIGNNIQGATSSTTVGVVQALTTASTFIIFDKNVCINNKASSVHAVTGMAGLIGSTFHNGYGILDNATTAGFETEGSVQFFDDHTANDAGAASVTKTPT